MKAKRDSEIQNTLDYILSGDITRKQAAKRLEQLCEDYYDSQIKPVGEVYKSKSTELNIVDANGWRFFDDEKPPLNIDIEVNEVGIPVKRKITSDELEYWDWTNYCWRNI